MYKRLPEGGSRGDFFLHPQNFKCSYISSSPFHQGAFHRKRRTDCFGGCSGGTTSSSDLSKMYLIQSPWSLRSPYLNWSKW